MQRQLKQKIRKFVGCGMLLLLLCGLVTKSYAEYEEDTNPVQTEGQDQETSDTDGSETTPGEDTSGDDADGNGEDGTDTPGDTGSTDTPGDTGSTDTPGDTGSTDTPGGTGKTDGTGSEGTTDGSQGNTGNTGDTGSGDGTGSGDTTNGSQENTGNTGDTGSADGTGSEGTTDGTQGDTKEADADTPADGDDAATNDGSNDSAVETRAVTKDLVLRLTNSVNGEAINGAEFLLTGTTTDTGKSVNMLGTTSQVQRKEDLVGVNGMLLFSDLEPGTYKLVETKGNEDYIISRDSWTVEVSASTAPVLKDKDGSTVETDTKDYQGTYYVLKNEPYHTLKFLNTSTYGSGVTLEGNTFSLTGTSDYGTEVNATAQSTSDGLVTFEGLEPGTYILQQTGVATQNQEPKTYKRNEKTYTVTIAANQEDTTDHVVIEGLETTTFANTSVKLYNFKNDPVGGYVKVTVKWQDDGSKRPENPVNLSISTKLPSKSENGYVLTFDANTGSFANGKKSNNVTYDSTNAIVEGTYKEPASDDGTFSYWSEDPTGTKKFEISSDGIPTTPLSADTTVYAQYKPTMKYAVAIYGIGVDTLQDGKAGLTFGPALGDNYVTSYKSHTPTGNTTSGNAHRCVHNDSWTTIIEWNTKDSWVYEQCIAEGCTKSVPLSKNSTKTILNDSLDTTTVTGDGPSVLFDELVLETQENLRWNPNDTLNHSAYTGTNNGGWGVSRSRAMMNGADGKTDIGTDYYSYYGSKDPNKSASIYTEDNCLLATFPTVLQQHIGKRQVKYYTSNSKNKIEITYDKLWSFSPSEMSNNVPTGFASAEERSSGLNGTCYEKMKNAGALYEYKNNDAYVSYNRSGKTGYFNMRSPSTMSTATAGLRGFGVIYDVVVSEGVPVAPGFTLKR